MRHPIVLLLFAAPAAAAPPAVTVVPPPAPAEWVELRADPGRHLVLSAGKEPASWLAADDCDLTPDRDGTTAVFTASRPGRYRVLVTGPGGTTRVAVTVGADPTPPPQPKPKPPEPKPQPPDAKPDALVVELRVLLAAEPEQTVREDGEVLARRDACARLAELYKLMVGECARAEYATPGQLNTRFRAAADKMLGKALTGGFRQRLGREIAAAVGPDPDAALTDAARRDMAILFARLARAVEEAAR